MSLKSTAQQQDLNFAKNETDHDETSIEVGDFSDLFKKIEEPLEEPLDVMEETDEPIEVSDHDGDEKPIEIVLSIGDGDDLPRLGGDLPGSLHSPEEILMVEDSVDSENQEQLSVKDDSLSISDENDAKKTKKNEKWDWESKGAIGFVSWVKERFESVPKHSGYDTAGLERAVSYLQKLDNEISKAMRLDIDGELDADKVEAIRSEIEEGIERLDERLDKVKEKKKGKKKKKADEEYSGFIKDAQKITGVQGIYIMAPLFASRIARICINSTVSVGHDLEDCFARQVQKWKLTDREQAEVMQLLADMGYPLRQDRGYMPDEDVDISSSDNFDWAANYRS